MLTAKQSRFIDEYLLDLNASDAAIRAGYSPKTAAATGWENLRKPDIQIAVRERRQDIAQRNAVGADRVIEELCAIAFTKLSDIAPWDDRGPRLIPSDELENQVAAAVSSLKVKRRREVNGKGEDAVVWEVEEREIKMHDKLGALDKLAKHLGLYPKDPTVYNDSRTLSLNGLNVEELKALASYVRGR